MNWLYGINVLILPMAGLIIILVDYLRSRFSDPGQRRLFVSIIIVTLLAIVFEYVQDIFQGRPEDMARHMVFWCNFSFFIFQYAAFCLATAFVDYTVNKDGERVSKILCVVGALMIINLAALVINWIGGSGFYYSVSEDHTYARSTIVWLKACISYLPFILLVTDFILNRKHLTGGHTVLFIFFVVPTAVGGTLDLLIAGARLVWPCFTVSMLFAYIFIIRADSRVDALTGVSNRRGCEEKLAGIGRSQRRSPMGFIMLDMDHFKDINDTFGHSVGDIALRDMAAILMGVIRRSDFVARYGGDEFMLIIANCTDISVVLARLDRAVEEFNAKKNRVFKIELSIGHDVYLPDDERTPQDFLSHVDALMYQHKGDRRRAV